MIVKAGFDLEIGIGQKIGNSGAAAPDFLDGKVGGLKKQGFGLDVVHIIRRR